MEEEKLLFEGEREGKKGGKHKHKQNAMKISGGGLKLMMHKTRANCYAKEGEFFLSLESYKYIFHKIRMKMNELEASDLINKKKIINNTFWESSFSLF